MFKIYPGQVRNWNEFAPVPGEALAVRSLSHFPTGVAGTEETDVYCVMRHETESVITPHGSKSRYGCHSETIDGLARMIVKLFPIFVNTHPHGDSASILRFLKSASPPG